MTLHRTTVLHPPLFQTAARGHVTTVAALLKAGAAVEKANIALYMAAQEGHTAVVVALLGAGAEVRKTSENGRTPLWAAVQNSNEEIVVALIKAGENVHTATAKRYRAPDHGYNEGP